MIEIFSILLTLISLFIFSNFPLNYFYLKKKIHSIEYTFSEIQLLNIIINCNIFLILSFFVINLNLIFIIILTYTFFFFIIFKKEYLNLFKKNLYLNLTYGICFYSVAILIVKNGYLEYDALAHWIHKVKVFYQGGTVSNLKGLNYDYYPHLGSYLWAFFWKNSLIQNEYLGRLFFLYIFLISIFSINSKLSKKFSNFEKILIIFLIFYLSTNIYLFGGYQEYFLFFCFYCYSNFFYNFYISNKFSSNNYLPEIIILLTSNLFIWTKQEGLFYFIIFGVLFLLHSKRPGLSKVFYFLMSVGLFLYFIFIKNYYFGSVEFNDEIINSETFKNLQISYLISKIIIITKYFIISFFKYPIWILIFLSLIVIKTNSNYLENKNFIYTYFLLMFGFVYAIFLNTPNDINWLVPITLNRLVFAQSGFLIFICVEMLNRLKNRN